MLSKDAKYFNPKVIHSFFNVNELSEGLHHNRSKLLGDILSNQVLSYQQDLLSRDLGNRYQRDNRQASFSCPRCGRRRFTRKGKRNRIYKCSLGKITIPVVQVRCSGCGHRFSPYKDEIGLSFAERSSQGLNDRQIILTCDVPYRKARDFIHLCLDVSLSPPTVRKLIDRKAATIRSRPVTADGKVVYEDSTKAKAGIKERGESLHLAITAAPGSCLSGRNQMIKEFLFLTTGSGDAIKERLKSLNSRAIVHDGDMDLTGCAPLIQRCLWHLPHQLHHFLWQDGLGIEARRPYVKELITALHGSRSAKKMIGQYSKVIERLRSNGFDHASLHLERAKPEIHIALENKIFYSTTSPVEREMRELNRRSDVGVRWSVPGVENLLLVKTDMRLNKKNMNSRNGIGTGINSRAIPTQVPFAYGFGNLGGGVNTHLRL